MKRMLQVFFVASSIFAAGAFAEEASYQKGDIVYCDKSCRPGGGDAPFPFLQANQLFELADGSAYNLYGKIVIARAPDGSDEWMAYLLVDLKKHGWLLNERRLEDPRYPLLGTLRFWRQFEGDYVRLGGFAKTETFWHKKGYAKTEVMLATSLFRIERESKSKK